MENSKKIGNFNIVKRKYDCLIKRKDIYRGKGKNGKKQIALEIDPDGIRDEVEEYVKEKSKEEDKVRDKYKPNGRGMEVSLLEKIRYASFEWAYMIAFELKHPKIMDFSKPQIGNVVIKSASQPDYCLQFREKDFELITNPSVFITPLYKSDEILTPENVIPSHFKIHGHCILYEVILHGHRENAMNRSKKKEKGQPYMKLLTDYLHSMDEKVFTDELRYGDLKPIPDEVVNNLIFKMKFNDLKTDNRDYFLGFKKSGYSESFSKNYVSSIRNYSPPDIKVPEFNS